MFKKKQPNQTIAPYSDTLFKFLVTFSVSRIKINQTSKDRFSCTLPTLFHFVSDRNSLQNTDELPVYENSHLKKISSTPDQFLEDENGYVKMDGLPKSLEEDEHGYLKAVPRKKNSTLVNEANYSEINF